MNRMPNKVPSYRPAGMGNARRDYERSPRRAEDNAFYWGQPWRRLRDAFIAEHPLCSSCQSRGEIEPARVVDHVIPRRQRPDLELDWDNLQSLCNRCHGMKRAREKG
jgi:5-methylcytosine-specific restriction protein A